MRTLVLSYEFPPIGGGGAYVVHGLSRELVALGHDVDLVTMRFRDLPRVEQVDGINVHRVSCQRRSASICHPHEMLTYVLAALPLVVRLVRRHRYDLNHTHFIFPDGLIARVVRMLTGLPYVITTHGSDVPGYNPDRFQRHHRLLAPLWRWTTRGAERLVCPSDTLAALVREQSSQLPVTLIPNGIAADRFDATRPKRDRILVVTRLFRRKGVQYLLDALREMPGELEVHIVGDGPYLPTLRERAVGLRTRVVFHGWLDNESPQLRELYETSRFFVFTSQAENAPIVLLEAMSAGMTIITSAGTGTAETIGDAGVLVEPRDAAAIRRALESLRADPQRCAELGRRAKRRLEEHFTWSVVARRYLRLFAQHGRGAAAPDQDPAPAAVASDGRTSPAPAAPASPGRAARRASIGGAAAPRRVQGSRRR